MAKWFIEIDAPEGMGPRDLEGLLRDAVKTDFRLARTPVEAYVERRYGEQTESFRENKVQEVTKRLAWVYEMRILTARKLPEMEDLLKSLDEEE